MKKLQQEQMVQKDRFSGLVIMVLVLLVAVLSIGRVFAANRLVEASENLRRLDLEATNLEKENRLLAAEVRLITSGNFLEAKAKELGFVKNSHFAYLSVTPEMAFNK